MKKITLITSIGAGLEYYDFTIYALLATYISHNFFPQSAPHTALLKTFAIFAVGYLARPIGGIVLGITADRYGRKKTFSASIILMAVATLGIGLLPTYSQIGWQASFYLLILRLLQGVAFGAELPGAITFLTEHLQTSKRGFYCSFMLSSLSIGATLGSMFTFFLTYLLQDEQMLAWGWRIPFLVGSLLAIIGYWMRRSTQETPQFIQHKQAKQSTAILATLIKRHFKSILQGLGIILLTGCLIIFGLSMPAYLHTYYDYALPDIYRANTLSLIGSVLMLPLFGLLSDKIGRKLQLMVTSLVFAVISFWLFKLLNLHHQAALFSFMLLYQVFIAATATCYIPLSAELFPTPVRYTGLALCYNAASLISSLTPLFTNSIAHTFGPTSVAIFFSALALITFGAGLSTKHAVNYLSATKL